MSVIWSGVTEEGAVVPVQVTAEGKVVAVGDGPEGDYLKLTGGNLTGDLTIDTDKITLNAADGAGTFAGDVKAGDRDPAATTSRGVRVAVDSQNGGVYTQAKGSANPSTYMAFQALHGTTEKFKVMYDGTATFAGTIESQQSTIGVDLFKGGYGSATGAFVVRGNGTIVGNDSGGASTGNYRYKIDSNGSTTFASGACGFTSAGELFFTSRNARYKLVVSNGLCSAEPFTRQMELSEKAEQFIADNRETKPSEPSDPQPEVTTDNDNA